VEEHCWPPIPGQQPIDYSPAALNNLRQHLERLGQEKNNRRCCLVARVGWIDRRFQEHSGTASISATITTAAPSATNRALPQVFVVMPICDASILTPTKPLSPHRFLDAIAADPFGLHDRGGFE
jgi:hypothetical protein